MGLAYGPNAGIGSLLDWAGLSIYLLWFACYEFYKRKAKKQQRSLGIGEAQQSPVLSKNLAERWFQSFKASLAWSRVAFVILGFTGNNTKPTETGCPRFCRA